MKILLTGGSGMVGKNILEHSKAQKYKILAPTSSNLNLLNYKVVNKYLKLNQPDLIIHAAGKVGGIQANITNPVSFLSDNMEMGKNIVLSARENKIKKLINLGSSCMYPRNIKNPLKEEYVLQGELEPTNEGYALAKVMTARLCEYIGVEEEDLKYKTLIPCNLYGKYDKFSPKHSHMLPAVIRKIHEAKVNELDVVDIWGDGKSRREFMFAEDLADFIFFSIDMYDKLPQNINVGLGLDYTINEYYKTIAKVIGYKGKFIHDLSKPTGMRQKLIDDTNLKAMGWSYKTSLEEGVRKTYNYYLNTVIKK